MLVTIILRECIVTTNKTFKVDVYMSNVEDKSGTIEKFCQKQATQWRKYKYAIIEAKDNKIHNVKLYYNTKNGLRYSMFHTQEILKVIDPTSLECVLSGEPMRNTCDFIKSEFYLDAQYAHQDPFIYKIMKVFNINKWRQNINGISFMYGISHILIYPLSADVSHQDEIVNSLIGRCETPADLRATQDGLRPSKS